MGARSLTENSVPSRFFLELRLHSQIWADPWQPFRDARCLSVASLELLWRNEKGKIDMKENGKTIEKRLISLNLVKGRYS